MLLVHHLLRLLLHTSLMFDPPMLLLLPHMLHIGQLLTGTVLTTDQLRKLEVWKVFSHFYYLAARVVLQVSCLGYVRRD